MGAYLYDEALLAKLKYWTEDTNVHVYSPEDSRQLFSVLADTSGDKPIQFPIICLNRNGGYEVTNTSKKPTTYNGKILDVTESKSTMLNVIPITLSYRLDVYTRFLKEADMYARNLVFNIINYPSLTIKVPYRETGFEHRATIRLSENVEDTSGQSIRLSVGQLTRFSLYITIDDAYLWDVRVVNNVSLDDTNIIRVQNPDSATYEEETINT